MSKAPLTRRKGPTLTLALDSKVTKLLEVFLSEREPESGPITKFEAVQYVRAHDAGIARSNRSNIEKSVERVLVKVQVEKTPEVEEKPAEPENEKKRPRENGSLKPLKRQKDRLPPSATLSELGGMDEIVSQLMELVGMPILHPEIYTATGVEPPRGVLLHGPPGCGKTTLANALAGELQVPFIPISAPLIVSGMSGESEKKVREVFQEARNLAPCLIFIDEIDAITPKRDGAQREMEKRIVAQMLTCIDELSMEKNGGKPVIIIGATNRPDSLDPALRRAGRFDREICLNVPTEESRIHILKAMTKNLKIDGELDYVKLAKATPGYVGADLKALASQAGICAIKRIFTDLSEKGLSFNTITPETTQDPTTVSMDQEMDVNMEDLEDLSKLSTIQKFLKIHPSSLTPEQLEPLSIKYEDFLTALPTIQPTAKREGFATIPDVSWSNVGALSQIRVELHMAIVQPIKRPELYEKFGISAPGGVLLWGPPGCGKTLLAKAVANESRANFILVKGPELLNKYVGESEKAVRQVFTRARASVPCIIFFDELDALVPKRDSALSELTSRVVNTLLTELDGLNDRKGIYVIGATNRPDIIDPAMLRPGRLDKTLYVELPTQEEKLDILNTIVRTNKTPIASDVDLVRIAKDSRLEFFSGADLAALVREAGVCALKKKFYKGIENLDENVGEGVGANEVTMEDFEDAMQSVRGSVLGEELDKYHEIHRGMNQ